MVTNRVQEGFGRSMLAPYLLIVDGLLVFFSFLVCLFSSFPLLIITIIMCGVVSCLLTATHGHGCGCDMGGSSPVRLERVKIRNDMIGPLCFVVGEGRGLCHVYILR